MANQYYTASGVPAAATRGVSASIRSEFSLIQTAFDSLSGTTMFGATNGGTVNAYTLTSTTIISSYTTGLICEIVPTITNTGASTLTISSGSAKALNSVANAALVAGDLVAGITYLAAYNGTNFVLLETTKRYIDAADALLAPKASPTFTGTVTAGVINGTSFNSITALSSTTPAALGTAAVGTSTTVARSDHVHLAPTTITGNAGTATTLQTARTINGTSFNGSANITVTAAANTLTGTSLNTTVLGSSLTSLGTIATGVWNGTTIDVAYGGTGATTATAGFNALAPSQTTFSGRYLTTDGTNASWATVSLTTGVSGTLPTANGGTGSTSTTFVNAASNITGTLPIANGGTGATTANTAFNALAPAQTTASGKYLTSDGTNTSWVAVSGTGTVTSVAASVPSIFSITGSPITTSGTLAMTYSGTALPIANGGTGLTTTPTNGQLDIGNGTGFTRAALTAGSNITITNGAGSITIASTGGGSTTSIGLVRAIAINCILC
jgi:hypothetical protein